MSGRFGPAAIDLFSDGDEEVFMSDNGKSSSTEVNTFDKVVGLLEEIIMDEEFVTLCDSFCQRYCHEFEDTDENKLSYSDIHSQYCATVEKYITDHVCNSLHISEEEFASIIEESAHDLSGDVFDILNSFSDFTEFKGLMLVSLNCSKL
jgi:ADP-ribosylation factor 2-binding protein